MAYPSNSKGKAKCVGPGPYDYLDGLREEFELQSDATSMTLKRLRPSRFNIYLGALKGEFELMAEEIESLRKERQEREAKVQAQAKELLDVRRHVICQRCNKGTMNPPQREVLQSGPSTSRPSSLFRFRSFDKPDASSRVVNPFQQTIRRSTQDMTVTRKPSSQSESVLYHTPIPNIVAHYQTVALPSASSQLPASTFNPNSGLGQRNWSIKFNHKVEKELKIQMVHILLHEDTISCVKFSGSGDYLAAGCEDGKVYIYNTETGARISVLKNLLADEDHIMAVCFSRDGSCLATSSWNGACYIWEIKTRHVRCALKGHTRWSRSLDFSPNGRLLVAASDDNAVWLWNTRDGAAKTLTEDDPTFLDNSFYGSAVFSPDGRYIAASHREGIVRIWDIRTGQLLRRVMAHMGWENVIAFMPHGKGLMSGSSDKTLKYWDISSLYTAQFGASSETTNGLHDHVSGIKEQIQPQREFLGHKDYVYSLAISPDGRWVASGSHDESVCIWDTSNAAMQCILNGRESVYSVDFSPAGNYLASGGYYGTLWIWRYSNVPSTPRIIRQEG